MTHKPFAPQLGETVPWLLMADSFTVDGSHTDSADSCRSRYEFWQGLLQSSKILEDLLRTNKVRNYMDCLENIALAKGQANNDHSYAFLMKRNQCIMQGIGTRLVDEGHPLHAKHQKLS